LGRLAACIARSKCIIHTPHGHIFYGYFSKPLTGFFIALERLCQTWTNALITLTEKEKTDYLEKGIGPASKIYPVLSGIDLGPFLNPDSGRGPARNSLGLGETDFVAGTVARLVPVKNHAMIIEAAALLKDRLPGMRFVFIGDGELHQDLLNRICSLGMDGSFVFTGWRNDIPSLLPAFDIFIMCSRNEGMGRAFVEAQAAGLPVIGSNVCGIPEVLVQGKTGFLVEPGNPGQLADTIRMLYDERDKLGERAVECRKWAQEHFSADVMVEKIEEIYKKTGYLS